MVFYIRFLKPPRIDIQKGAVRCLVTVTTDLGDDFYSGSLTLYATAVTSQNEQQWQSPWQTVEWKTGMRVVWIEIQNIRNCQAELLHLLVNTQPTLVADDVLFADMPEVLSARSDSFGRESGWDKCQANDRIGRRYRTRSGPERMIYEDTSESIARHIWDAGITLAAYLSHIVSQSKPESRLAGVLSQPHAPKIIELGSGCGIVGLELAHLCCESNIFLTDLPDAMEILSYNISHSTTKFSSRTGRITTAVLDWEKALPDDIYKTKFDLIFVSDCTYNSDSIPALVNTLTALIKRSPAALIVVSMKVRHESEAIFFDLIADAGLIEIDHVKIALPDRQRQAVGQSMEAVDIYIYVIHAES